MIGQKENQSKLQAFINEYRQEIKFVLIFSIGILVSFKMVYNQTVANNIIKPITAAETYVAAVALEHIFGFPNEQKGTFLYGKRPNLFQMEVRNNCNGIFESIVFLWAFIAIQISWRRKIGWMLFGFALFHFINEMRLVSLFIIGSKYSNSTFVFFHETFWNFALVIFTIAIFIFCAYKVSKSPEEKAALTKAEA